MSDKEALLKKIGQSDKLPMLPDIAVQIIELGNEQELYPGKVAAVIANDPVLCAKLLQVSNSSMFPFRREITCLDEALAILGVELTMSICMGFAIVGVMRGGESKESGFQHEIFWRKSVLGAIAAIEMKSELNGTPQGSLFIASLLQDIGIIVLEKIVGKQYVQIVNGSRSHLDLVELERRVFGVDHAEVGAAMLKAWNIPEELVDAVSSSHHLLECKAAEDLSWLQYGVSLSGLMAEQWIAESAYPERLDDVIKSSLERIGDEGYKKTVEKTVEAIPAANDIFNIQLLSSEQLASVA